MGAPFKGFALPEQNWSKLPHEFIQLMPDMKLAELRVVLYVLRHTWGYAEYDTPKRISVDEFVHGRKSRDGSRLDRGTGLSEQSVRNGLSEAVEHGYLIVEVDDTDKGRIEKAYALNIQGSKIYTPDPKILTPEPQNLDPVHRKKLKKETYTPAPEVPPLTDEQLQEVIVEAKAKVDAVLEQERLFQEQETYPNRTKFPAGELRDMADAYVKHTGQRPTKKQVTYWTMIFNDWKDSGYTVKVLDIALRHAVANKLTITSPASLAAREGGLMAWVDGELRKGNTFPDLQDKPAEHKYWRKVGGDPSTN